MRSDKLKHQAHHIEIEGDIGKLTAYTKKGKPVVAIFDATDMDHITAFKNWRAIWKTDFDCQVIESKDFIDKKAVRTPVSAAILKCSPNAPICHINGDILDNRRVNLDIYDVKAQPNESRQTGDEIAIVLKDRYGRVVGEAIIDATDFDLVMTEHVWLKKRHHSGQPYVVNQNGRLLAHVLLGITEGKVSYQNKNPLDNRRKNIKKMPEKTSVTNKQHVKN